MPAPAAYTFTDALNVSAQTLVLNAIEAGAGAGVLNVYSAADLLLVAIPLNTPAGTVSGTGQLPITASGPGTAVADGTAAWGEIVDSNGAWVMKAPVVEGASAVPGNFVLTETAILTSAEISLVSATIG